MYKQVYKMAQQKTTIKTTTSRLPADLYDRLCKAVHDYCSENRVNLSIQKGANMFLLEGIKAFEDRKNK